jgi:hypothetical protein
MFFSIFVPFGIDYFYLEQYFIFVIILSTCCLAIVGNCYRFTVSQNPNYFADKSNLFFIVLAILAVLWWIVNVFITAFGLINDSNGFETVSDLNMLFFGPAPA